MIEEEVQEEAKEEEEVAVDLVSEYKEMYKKKLKEIEESSYSFRTADAVMILLDIAASFTSSDEILYAADQRWEVWEDALEYIADVIDYEEGIDAGISFREAVEDSEDRIMRANETGF